MIFFFFKHKTAYEMRISDWSSDVCSSDLAFEIEDRTGGDQIAVERAFGQELRRAEKGVHRPLAIGGDEDQAARGGGLARAHRGIERDARIVDVVLEDAQIGRAHV